MGGPASPLHDLSTNGLETTAALSDDPHRRIASYGDLTTLALTPPSRLP